MNSGPYENSKPLDGCSVYVIGGNYAISTMFVGAGAALSSCIDDARIVCWTGGADVHPDYYSESKHPSTSCDKKRDAFEAACFKRARGKIKVGICRGGQFLNVMNGGTLWQDVDNHAIAGTHPMTYRLPLVGGGIIERQVQVTSTHHQMMIPNLRSSNKAEVWGTAALSTRKTSGVKDATGKFVAGYPNKAAGDRDCEILYYPDSRSLCFQPHPEYASSQTKPTRELFLSCLERVLLRMAL